MRSTRRRRSHGQSMVEFAVMAPVFFVLLFGTIDLGRAVYIYNSISDAAREGARAAVPFDSPLPTNSTVLSAVNSKLGGGFAPQTDPCLTNNSATCPSTPTQPNTGLIWYSSNIGTPGRHPVAVKITFYYQPVIPLISEAAGNRLMLTAESTMVTEY